MYSKYYKAVILIVAAGFAALMVGCSGPQKSNQQTGQTSQKTTQQPTGAATTAQGGSKEKPHGKSAATKGKAGQKAGNKSGQEAKGAQKAGGKNGQTKSKAGNERVVARGFLGRVKYKESKIYFNSQSGKIIPLVYHAKHLRVTLDSKKARLRDLKQGQRVRVVYVSEKVKKKEAMRDYRYVVHSIKAYAKGGKKPASKQKNTANG